MKQIYAIRDRLAQDLAGTFPLVVFRTDAQAIRYFHDCAVAEGSSLGAHLGDYELINCGQIEDTGLITPQVPVIVITGDTMKATLTLTDKDKP